MLRPSRFRSSGRCGLALEYCIGPPLLAGAMAAHGLGNKLIAIVAQRVNIDPADLSRPEATPAGFVVQIGALVGRANEKTLPRLVTSMRP